eukprot:evm.model.NODE_26452_length_18161_cov_25.339739.1
MEKYTHGKEGGREEMWEGGREGGREDAPGDLVRAVGRVIKRIGQEGVREAAGEEEEANEEVALLIG